MVAVRYWWREDEAGAPSLLVNVAMAHWSPLAGPPIGAAPCSSLVSVAMADWSGQC